VCVLRMLCMSVCCIYIYILYIIYIYIIHIHYTYIHDDTHYALSTHTHIYISYIDILLYTHKVVNMQQVHVRVGNQEKCNLVSVGNQEKCKLRFF
jgi:hypothetical protein